MRLRWLGWGAVALIAVTMAAMVALSVRAALAANRQDVGVLHLIG
ncbi:MAG: cell division protein FtsX, partial [Planctomycetales bacterium]|nr:cell division protein FtsX [Planctomycetales bacterium]NIN09194.1 cell division protein FtsX [Planctomycetales bacterium]NIN78292.1 cell division protein FtsX [Planctomycetales bacterium]NIP05372.1 cell division protein FtsX [Planctomycetales bacterium]NIP70641.1 cell division protein FtsX [Planctomycetales bacterium]